MHYTQNYSAAKGTIQTSPDQLAHSARRYRVASGTRAMDPLQQAEGGNEHAMKGEMSTCTATFRLSYF
jgi:hypothetical protein